MTTWADEYITLLDDCEAREDRLNDWERLSQFFSYDPLTGLFTRSRDHGRWKAGSKAGTLSAQGYVVINFGRRLYRAHRLAWAFCSGTLPTLQVDHINGDRADNRIKNLRLATNAENAQNVRAARSTNRSGLLGVVPNRARWAAQITVDGRTHHLGTFDTPEEAHERYLIAKPGLHPFVSADSIKAQIEQGRRPSDKQVETLSNTWERATARG